jgi:enamine deaminase RidA (YjgF/YER057c/UK114 family)
MIAARLDELGITLPPVFPPAGSYVGSVLDGNILYVGGHGPINGNQMMIGKVGREFTLAEGRAAARMTGLSCLATINAALGSMDRIERFIKVFGMVNVADGFDRMPAVIDGCSELLVEIFGEAGRHTRSAVGMAELPFGIPVEIEMILRIR